MGSIKLEFANLPLIGTTSSGQEIFLGGFSGLRFLGASSKGQLRFVTHTDRGPNTDERQTIRGQERPLGLPNFQPQLVFFDADVKLRKLSITRQAPLIHKDGKRVSGRPPDRGAEVAIDFRGKLLRGDPNGLDLEGIAIAADGSFWMAEEYAPSLVHFSPNGVLLERLLPGGGLPETLRYRRLNRGFESVAVFEKKIYAALESPLDNPPSEMQKNSRASRVSRIVEVDTARKLTTAQYAYLLEEADTGKISDICMDGPETLLVLESGRDWKRIYRAHLSGVTNLQRLSSTISGPSGTLELLPRQEYAKNGVLPVRKELLLDLNQLGVSEEKVEGIDRIDSSTLALITDNDFGLEGALDIDKGIALEKEDEKYPALYLISLEDSN